MNTATDGGGADLTPITFFELGFSIAKQIFDCERPLDFRGKMFELLIEIAKGQTTLIAGPEEAAAALKAEFGSSALPAEDLAEPLRVRRRVEQAAAQEILDLIFRKKSAGA
jgi:hypothetical protein